MNVNKKTLKILGITLAITLGVAGAYYYLFSIIKDKTAATSILTEKINELSGRESRIASSVSTLRAQADNIDKLSTYFFNINDIVTFTKQIENLGEQSGTKLTISSLEQGTSDKSNPLVNFRIQAEGKFVNIERLLILLENFPGKFQWKSINLRQSGGTGATSVWSVDISLTALNFVSL